MEEQDIQQPESEDEALMDDLEMAEADGPAAVNADTPDLEAETEYAEEAEEVITETSSDEIAEENSEEASDEPAGELTEEPVEPSVEATANTTPISDTADIVRDIEAILFIAPDPVSLEVLSEVTDTDGEDLAHAVEAVREKYSDPDGGIVFAEIAGGYTFRTGDFARDAVERFCRRPIDYSLSPAAMETLAIVAYLQPITRPEIARIRGVGADTVVANLLDKGLVAEAGRAQQTGAVKYRTTESFEKLFGIADLADLPPLEGFEATPADVEELREKLHLAADKRQ
ncbi:MAG: SMC-Scp complex subunit ScpB [Actinobacteria bacterium]|nr:SMC-Scp complex subunit ScpB [Actinomycetota bacterium]